MNAYLLTCRLLAAILLLVLSISCSETITTSQSSRDIQHSRPADEKSSLVVYSGRSESLVGPIIREFESLTGIDVKTKYGSTSEIAGILMEEGSSSRADLFIAQDPGGLGAVGKAGLLAQLPSDIMNLAQNWARSPEDNWIGLSGRARTLVYNTEQVQPSEIPDSLAGLTDPKWSRRIGWAPSNTSFQTMITAMRMIWGENETQKWLLDMQNNQPKVYPKNSPQVAAVGSGEIHIGLVNHYYLHRFIKEHGEAFPARNHYLSGNDPGNLMMLSGIGMLNTAENQSDAKNFIKFMLSKTAQTYFTTETFEYPVVEGINTDRSLRAMSQINHPEVDLADLADLEGTQAILRNLGIIP